MSRNRKAGTVTIIPDLSIIDIAEEGKGVGKADELVVFVEKAVPGDVVDVRVIKKKKNFAEAVIEQLHKKSAFRTEPFCQHFGTCGGCKWQQMEYAAQLKFKHKNVEAALQRLAKIDTTGMEPILGSAQNKYYRNKLEYTFSNKRWLNKTDMMEGAETGAPNPELEMNALGFHVPLRFDKILDIEHCYLQAEPSNTIRNEVRDYALKAGLSFYDLRNHEGSLRNLVIRTSSTGEVMVAVVFAYVEQEEIIGLMEFLKNRFPEITALLYIVNQKKNDTIFDQEVITYAGRDHIFEEMEGLKFKIGVKSFYQTNSDQAHELYKITKEFAGFSGDELVYDLYTGAGTIANFVARSVKQVVGIEYVPTAIEDAKFNATLNGIDNTVFYAGDMKDILTREFIAEHGKPDVVITDPPRAGMHADVVERLLEMEAGKIVYVSCNAATQARDLALLKEKYEVVRIKPVDMFPHTQHVENVVLLKFTGAQP
ncbi:MULTISPECIES: 23S rRNA (uracil(1939)-C(5))-methyltransferase RlmD [Pedobacter]|uniref:RNA methyltransferase, TrmA family n=1 Tax=Pedobacter heparinus (strain ATCC 13125 / DSM 2366 / CIP 104194 / JCM 7457 / NBRC 12017 / NCIMB 9290 / NRRL B-14731 / HIM 762-3) TaxID=485917 RepID=C6XU21_PEDHD|nr:MULTISPECIES: 23S rRNA (uracil(1939)-C(5))-methyltransferase RlmD [Pedobacter]ACU05814.1 RNA methyltransferase, TrmA family [Pedobacter heparinus DSM 2366]MBB5440919.1 23S rRNA (uracil1939-C5)-methyltransferase [Pedobacter sp. AK017]